MRIGFKKTIATIAVAGALSLGGGAIAQADTDRATIPDVVGISESAALQALADAGFTNVTTNYDRPDAIVIGTSFQAGTQVNENASILVMVGRD
ncbi:PASTA domain-containing protein [Rhodococcoides fascians A25f]|uniref:PASTA domain-containing protein n=1 Tax=Rhodococcoides fascians TaxID=1828 RepID=UPI00056013C1|nr:PASTA domain-containing protein [Rhodococcus fascians]QII07475.1 PASTA domain-containing protein [Rhodococcus fascians A25f]